MENDVAALLPTKRYDPMRYNFQTMGLRAQMRIIGARQKPVRSATSLDITVPSASQNDHGVRGTIKGTCRHFWTDVTHSKTRCMFKWPVIRHRRGNHHLTHKIFAPYVIVTSSRNFISHQHKPENNENLRSDLLPKLYAEISTENKTRARFAHQQLQR